jgi:hypothetical protein
MATADGQHRLVDSAPIRLCIYQRASGNRTVTGPEYFSVMQNRRA